jgi:hypothetical protein
MINAAVERLARRALLAVLGLILLSTITLALAGLVIDETTTTNPAPIIAVGGALAGAGVMTLAKKIDRLTSRARETHGRAGRAADLCGERVDEPPGPGIVAR